MCGFVRVDGRALRFMGRAEEVKDQARQISLEVRPTQTIYKFDAQGVMLTITFTAPMLLDDLDLLSRPVNYVTFDATSADGAAHEVQIYFDATAEWAVNKPEQQVQWDRVPVEGLEAMRVGTSEQKVLATKGDDVRIDWGHFLVAVPLGTARTAMADAQQARAAFAAGSKDFLADDAQMPRAARDRWPTLATVIDLGSVAGQNVRRHLVIAYDDVQSVQYFGEPLRAWWRRDAAMTIERMLGAAEREYDDVLERCNRFDAALDKRLARIGCEEYSRLCRLVYRQAVAAHKLVAGPDGRPLFFSKENFSNGSIGTVDVTYPSAPLFLIYNPRLVEGMMDPIFALSESGRWNKPFAAHDVGTYPLANGQTYPEDMPVEESGNMLILAAAIAKAEGSSDYARRHWKALTTWAEYLKQEGFDPAIQEIQTRRSFLRWRATNPKSEARNTKSETNPNDSKLRSKTVARLFGTLGICASNLFRISDFVLRDFGRVEESNRPMPLYLLQLSLRAS